MVASPPCYGLCCSLGFPDPQRYIFEGGGKNCSIVGVVPTQCSGCHLLLMQAHLMYMIYYKAPGLGSTPPGFLLLLASPVGMPPPPKWMPGAITPSSTASHCFSHGMDYFSADYISHGFREDKICVIF